MALRGRSGVGVVVVVLSMRLRERIRRDPGRLDQEGRLVQDEAGTYEDRVYRGADERMKDPDICAGYYSCDGFNCLFERYQYAAEVTYESE